MKNNHYIEYKDIEDKMGKLKVVFYVMNNRHQIFMVFQLVYTTTMKPTPKSSNKYHQYNKKKC